MICCYKFYDKISCSLVELWECNIFSYKICNEWHIPNSIDKYYYQNLNGSNANANSKYTAEFKEEAVRQVIDRGHSVVNVAKRLEIGGCLLYT